MKDLYPHYISLILGLVILAMCKVDSADFYLNKDLITQMESDLMDHNTVVALLMDIVDDLFKHFEVDPKLMQDEYRKKRKDKIAIMLADKASSLKRREMEDKRNY